MSNDEIMKEVITELQKIEKELARLNESTYGLVNEDLDDYREDIYDLRISTKVLRARLEEKIK